MTGPLFGAPEPAPLVPPVTYLPDWLPEHVATMAWCERNMPWEHAETAVAIIRDCLRSYRAGEPSDRQHPDHAHMPEGWAP